MNKTRYILAASFAVAIGAPWPSAHAAAVVTYSTAPAYAVTTVRTTGPYLGIQPAPCCYTRVVVKPTATVAVATPVPAPARVVYAAPPVIVYPATRPIYVPTTYYPTTYYYVP